MFVVGGYLGFAAVWLVVSDKLFAILATTYSERRLLHLFNDAVFVGVALAAMLTVVALHRRRAARELRHTQAQLLTFIRTAPFSIAMFDIEMHALAWSDRWLAEFGGTNADLPDAWREAHARATQGESTRRDEDPWRRSDGTLRWLRWAVVPWRDPRGDIGGTIFSATDFTATKQAMDALVAREARYRAAIETASDGFWAVDVGNGQLIDVNEAYAQRSGYPREMLIGMPIAALEAAESTKEVMAHMRRIRAGSRDKFETRHRAASGEIWPVEIIAAYWEQAGGVAFAFIRDIGDRKDLERRIVEAGSEEQARIGREIHDGIGQRLTAIGMLANGVQRKLAGGGHVAAAAAIGDLLGQVQETIRETRFIAHGLSPLQIGPDGLADALEQLGLHADTSQPGRLTVETIGIVPSMEPVVALQFYRIAQEAVNNAIKHARAETVRIELRGDGVGAVLSVEDDGVGMPADIAWSRTLGVSTMRYRASLIGANLSILPGRRAGTVVRCSWRATGALPQQ